MITWLVSFCTTEKNFPKRAAAVAWLRARTHDTRPMIALFRRARGAYRYFGPGEDRGVLVADIDRLDFPPLRYYGPRPRAKRETPDAQSTPADVRGGQR